MKIITLILAIIWTVISLFFVGVTIDEKKITRDGSWKIFLMFSVLFVLTAFVLWDNFIRLIN